VVKRRASGIVKKLTGLVRKYRKYRSCVPKVLAVVAAFKAKKYGTAVRKGYDAFRCIRSKS